MSREGVGEDGHDRALPRSETITRSQQRSEGRPSVTRESIDSPPDSSVPVAGDLSSGGSEVASVTQGEMAVTLVALPRIDVEDVVYGHQRTEPGETRPVALFDVENRGEEPFRWRSARTKFVGSDDYTYRPAHLSLDPARLGPGCHTRQVEVEPGRRARIVTLVERLPRGVEISEVVHAVSTGVGRSERLVFQV